MLFPIHLSDEERSIQEAERSKKVPKKHNKSVSRAEASSLKTTSKKSIPESPVKKN